MSVPCSLLSQLQGRQQTETAESRSPQQGRSSEVRGASSSSLTGLAKETEGESSQSYRQDRRSQCYRKEEESVVGGIAVLLISQRKTQLKIHFLQIYET